MDKICKYSVEYFSNEKLSQHFTLNFLIRHGQRYSTLLLERLELSVRSGLLFLFTNNDYKTNNQLEGARQNYNYFTYCYSSLKNEQIKNDCLQTMPKNVNFSHGKQRCWSRHIHLNYNLYRTR